MYTNMDELRIYVYKYINIIRKYVYILYMIYAYNYIRICINSVYAYTYIYTLIIK